MPKKWLPLESNPEVINLYITMLGLKNPKVAFYDVFGVEPELLSMVPRPIRAMILLYPITKISEEMDAKNAEKQKTEVEDFISKNRIFYSKQTISNACGTMAILHSLANNINYIGDLEDGSPIDYLIKEGKDKTPEERAELIETNSAMDEVHALAAHEGVTENQSIDTDIDLHFTSFVRVNNRCVELDGRKPFPFLHGICSDDESFANAAAEAIKERMKQDPESLRYNIIALCDKSD